MADTCCDIVSESEESQPPRQISRAARRRRMAIRRYNLVGGAAVPETENEQKRQKLELLPETPSWGCENAATLENCAEQSSLKIGMGKSVMKEISIMSPPILVDPELYPKFGVSSVCGKRRDMEDAVTVRPSFCLREHGSVTQLHYFAVYDGHGCSHVATKCRDRLHELVKEEIEKRSTEWKIVMERSFSRMDKEVIAWNDVDLLRANCRCELQTPDCDAVGSTAVVAVVTPHKIIVANCGDSRAVLSRKGKAVPLSIDHKPDRPDELSRIEAAGGRVIYWDGPRVLGFLAMSRAIGDNYLKPYVSCEPEVVIIDRTAEDDCLILASDGLWDVVSNNTACGVALMCLRGKAPARAEASWPESEAGGENSDKACLDASMLLTKLALARQSSDNVSVVVIDLRRST
ncbi:probable protein phosphatase 2C 24 [Cornus florida]|uniref:probable protein phosphatase 2C 24 n=1 Tax=Cornus florida TaxID=4283 RepID=UPI0028A2D874|nr:probable protein phosphatase 2C 24 [Cornus florida]